MIAAAVLAAGLEASAFSYDARAPLNITYGSTTTSSGVPIRGISFASAGGRKVTGVIVRGEGHGKHPVVLFVHWLGDEATTNHTEFEKDAAALAKLGATSLLVDAQWAEKDWFDKRTTDIDYQRSIEQVVDLRRALDALLAQPNVDKDRVAVVAHDFGAMYSAVLAGIDSRPKWYVLMAGTPSFSTWFLLGAKPADIPAYVSLMAPLDPTNFLPQSTARGFYFQFSAHDRYITPENELKFFQSAPLPRTMSVYDIDHSMATPVAFADRLAWLRAKLGI